MLTVEIAGSSDQSAILDREEVVVSGIPFSKSSVPTLVRVLPSNTIDKVEIDEHAISSASIKTLEIWADWI
jgi:hypothetical protein